MKTPRIFLWIFLATLAAVVLIHAAEPATIKVSVNYPEPPSPEVVFAVFSRPALLSAKTQLTPWSTNSFALISATNASAFMSMAVSNSLTGEMGFSGERWLSLRLQLDLPLNAAKQ